MNRPPPEVGVWCNAPPTPSLRRPDLDPCKPPGFAARADPGHYWPEPPTPRISTDDNPWRGDRFMRALMKMQDDRRAACEKALAEEPHEAARQRADHQNDGGEDDHGAAKPTPPGLAHHADRPLTGG